MGSRLAVSALLLALSTACGAPRLVRLDTGHGAPLEYAPPTWNESVEVSASEFEHAMVRLVLEEPLTLHPSQAGELVRTSASSTTGSTRWERLARKSVRGLCRPNQPRGECLSFLDDVVGMSPRDKLAVALGLSIDPLRESIAKAVESTLTPQFFYAAILTGMVSWVALAANPEPVFTKAAAIVSAVLLIYLGVDTFLEVVKASLELKRATDRATTLEELQGASRRFAYRVGPQVSRVFILAVTVVVSQGTAGGASWLAARMPLLPGFSKATALGASQMGLNLPAVGQVSAVAVREGTLVISLGPTALAMVVRGASAGGTARVSAGLYRSWGSYSGFRKAMGPAGKGKQWHHIVEQTPRNVERFGPHALHNTENVIPLEKALHTRVSAFYSSIREGITKSSRLTVRQWLSAQSYEAQREFGLLAIENISKGVWR